MEAHRFDSLTKRLATRASRRSALRGLAGGALAAAGWAGAASAAPSEKVTICHWDDELGIYQQLSISENALGGHRRHGDFLLPENGTCGDCNTFCPATAGICEIGSCSAEGVCTYGPAPFGADCGKCRICDGAGECVNAIDETNPNVSCRDEEAGEFCCAGDCVQTGLDELNCGFCGNVCASGLTCCRGSCIDASTHQEHCGGCEQLCDPAIGTCTGGSCIS
jgi:hypothetical protein